MDEGMYGVMAALVLVAAVGLWAYLTYRKPVKSARK